ncbi:MAG: glycoside hydrolase family 5 protein [Anaerolineae bacterium]|uniref:glycoside hydrolase family 5 protein n=1 Tax=Candidatus Flexifilum breve TaxID=3140694 RepID=UPI001AC8C5B0|nr:glycoside hydrolase family 5 protein [Chloroflexota bacterium]MBN8634901.1 glycoside hydrolase family 5 protein [Anaerolineae bacterium]
MLRKLIVLLVLLVGVAPTVSAQSSAPLPVERCVNLGNMLEAPNEGEWGLSVEEYYFQTIADAGFDAVRIPTKWSGHADFEPPYTIDPNFFARMDEVIGWALDANLTVILNIHHYDELAWEPEAHLGRVLALWDQIGAHYADYPDTLIFEAMNEPNSALTPELWDTMQPQVIAAIRATNPERTIIVGGGYWNSLDGLLEMAIPQDDHLLATFHFYDPFEFTHQGAEWVEGMDVYLGTLWGSASDLAFITERLDLAGDWSARTGIPVLMGEFGAYSRADQASRLKWTAFVRETAEAEGLGWCYWEFGAGFGIFDTGTRQYNDLLPTLIPE